MLPQTSPKADTLPMIKAAPKVVEEMEYVALSYCSGCGINYTSDSCPGSKHVEVD